MLHAHTLTNNPTLLKPQRQPTNERTNGHITLQVISARHEEEEEDRGDIRPGTSSSSSSAGSQIETGTKAVRPAVDSVARSLFWDPLKNDQAIVVLTLIRTDGGPASNSRVGREGAYREGTSGRAPSRTVSVSPELSALAVLRRAAPLPLRRSLSSSLLLLSNSPFLVYLPPSFSPAPLYLSPLSPRLCKTIAAPLTASSTLFSNAPEKA